MLQVLILIECNFVFPVPIYLEFLFPIIPVIFFLLLVCICVSSGSTGKQGIEYVVVCWTHCWFQISAEHVAHSLSLSTWTGEGKVGFTVFVLQFEQWHRITQSTQFLCHLRAKRVVSFRFFRALPTSTTSSVFAVITACGDVLALCGFRAGWPSGPLMISSASL